MKKPSKVLQFSQQIKSQSWTGFKIANLRPSVDPNQPPMYIIDVQGQRGDGLVFTIPVLVMKERFDVLPAIKALEIAQGLLNAGINRLMTFTGCPCTADSECNEHKQAQVN